MITFAPSMIRNMILVAVGGAAGSVLRFLLSRLIAGSVLTQLPLGTMTVNVAGCLLIGLIYGWTDRGILANADLKLLLTVGFCGGFTTFSTFCNEGLSLFRSDQALLAALYTAASVFLGLLAVFAGAQLARL